MDRRSLLKIMGTSAVVPVFFSGIGSSAAPRFTYTIFDRRFPDSVAFAHRHALDGSRIFDIDGDIVSLLDDGLYDMWKFERVFINGLTAEPSLFYLTTLARDFGHDVFEQMQRGNLVKWIIGPDPNGINFRA